MSVDPANHLPHADIAGFGRFVLPYGSFLVPGARRRRVGVAVDDQILDLTSAASLIVPRHANLFARGTLDAFLATGPETWHEVREALLEWVADDTHEHIVAKYLIDQNQVKITLPFTVGDYVDFYASEHHASNVGQIFRPDADPLPANWKYLPTGYHGRAGTVFASGTDVLRPHGQRRDANGTLAVGSSTRLDFEAEVGFVVGGKPIMRQSVSLHDADRHLFGICLVNDWSARDIQAWENIPLGPFLGKSFATSISPWIVPMAALDAVRVPPPPRTHALSDYLDDQHSDPWGFDIQLQILLNGTLVSRPPFATMYWTAAQMLAHLTINGAGTRPGDLFASGTVSGPTQRERGSLLELSWNGQEPITLDDGTSRTFLSDDDTVTIEASAAGPDGRRLWLGEVTGTITG